MIIVRQTSEIPKTDKPVILAMGCFDGVHLGHQKVISTAVEQAAALGGEAWVFTFNPHPAKVLVPDKAPPLISAEPCRMRKIEELGVHGIIEIPFDREFAAIEPDAFLSNLWKNIPSLAGVVCGQDWSFGCRAAGNFQTLETFGKQNGFTATAVAPVMDGEQKISSTTIRKAIADGNIPLAEKLLGRPFSLFGTVVAGAKIGRELGFPTANIDPLNELLPGNGIYAARTRIQGSGVRGQKAGDSELSPAPCSLSTEFSSAVFIGPRETFGCQQHVIESHLLDFDGDLYGQTIEVCLVKKIRAATPFPSKEALREQIEKDVAQVREILKNR